MPRLTHLFQHRDRRLLAIALALAIFALDAVTPLGVASAVPYATVILLTLSRPQPRFTIAMACFCAVLTILDLFISVGPGSTEYWKVLVNRGLALFAIGVTTTLGIQRNRAAEEARQHLDLLARAQRAQTIEQLAMAIAHELNQPLAACSLQAEVALATLPASCDSVRPMLDDVVEQAQRASSILRSLRELVQNRRSDRSTIDPNDLARAVLKWFDPTARQHAIQVEAKLAQHLPSLIVDRVQIEQVLMNLLQNACDALTAGNSVERTITLTTSEAPTATDAVQSSSTTDLRPRTRSIQFRVIDTGPGVTTDMRSKLFDKFYTTKPNGMGIGLAMSRSIVEEHGGRIWLEETPASAGASFVFELPTR